MPDPDDADITDLNAMIRGVSLEEIAARRQETVEQAWCRLDQAIDQILARMDREQARDEAELRQRRLTRRRQRKPLTPCRTDEVGRPPDR